MPLRGNSWAERSCLRLGVNEVTRRGMKEIKELAGFVSRALVEESQDVAVEVTDYIKSYHKVMYCFDQAATTAHARS